MALAVVGDLAYPKPSDLLATLLSHARYGYAKRGLEANVKPQSDLWWRCKGVGERLSIAIANNQIALGDLNPNAATGDALVTLSAVFGVAKRAASRAAGFVTATTNAIVTIPAGFEVIAPNGQRYETVGATLVGIGDSPVEVIALETGSATDQTAGTVMQWAEASIGALQQTCVVGSGDPVAGDISGGEDEDTDEKLRERLLRRLAFPSTGGNWAQIAEWAEEATSSVWAAFPYPAVRGPASVDVAVASSGGDRTLSPAILAQVVTSITENLPEHCDLSVTTVAPEDVDIVIDLTLPLPVNAGGAGGGWRDTTPWPTSVNAADGRPVRVTSVDLTNNQITVNATAANVPSTGHRFGLWDKNEQEMREFTVKSRSGSAGAYVITIDTAVSGALKSTDDEGYVSAGCVNLVAYAEEFLAQMNALGPGEKSASTDVLPHGARRPGPDVEHGAALTTVQLRPLSEEHQEILDITYGARLAAGAGTVLTTPTVPAATADAPKILHLSSLAFRKA